MLRRFAALPAADRRLVIEAAVLFGFAALGLRVYSLPKLRRILSPHQPRGFRNPRADDARRVAWAVGAVARRLPRRAATCLVAAVAADALLRRRGCPSEVRVGVRAIRPFAAHAWVESSGCIVVGELEDANAYGVVFAPAQA